MFHQSGHILCPWRIPQMTGLPMAVLRVLQRERERDIERQRDRVREIERDSESDRVRELDEDGRERFDRKPYCTPPETH